MDKQKLSMGDDYRNVKKTVNAVNMDTYKNKNKEMMCNEY